jgi:hypothetical protein
MGSVLRRAHQGLKNPVTGIKAESGRQPRTKPCYGRTPFHTGRLILDWYPTAVAMRRISGKAAGPNRDDRQVPLAEVRKIFFCPRGAIHPRPPPMHFRKSVHKLNNSAARAARLGNNGPPLNGSTR